MIRYYIFILLLVTIPLVAVSQSSFQLGVLPSVNINSKLPKDWSVNLKAESRQSLIREGFDYEYLLTDISLIAGKKIGINTSIAAGYLLRIDGKEIRNRAIQQISIVRKYSGFIISHRISADQTFDKDDHTEYRLRYRLSSEIPLSGQSSDPKEFFLKASNEYLNSLQNKEFDLEIRTSAFIGYVLTPRNKLELGLEYRADSFINQNLRNRLWIALNIYQLI